MSWVYIRHILGISWANLRGISGISWTYFGHILGIFWAYLGHILGISWTCFGHILGIFWACMSRAHLRHIFGLSWAYLEYPLAHLVCPLLAFFLSILYNISYHDIHQNMYMNPMRSIFVEFSLRLQFLKQARNFLSGRITSHSSRIRKSQCQNFSDAG